jgi:PilZ domain
VVELFLVTRVVDERRRSERIRTLRAGKILLNNKRSVIDCMIRNLSRDGACLLLASVVGIPPTFELLIDGEPASRQCKTVWHGPNRVGVAFQ